MVKMNTGPGSPRFTRLKLLPLAGLMLLFLSCNTEGNHSPWYLPWSDTVIPLSDPLQSGNSSMPLGGFRSLMFPDGSTRHFLLSDPGSGAALELRIFNPDWTQAFKFSSRRLDSASLELSWVDEYGNVHLPSPSGTGECLVPPTADRPWTAKSTGDPAWFFWNGTSRRFGMGGQGALELALDLDGYPDIAITWSRLSHNADGSLVETPGSVIHDSLPLYSDGMLNILTQAWPDQARTHTALEFQTALAGLAALGPGNIPCQTQAMRLCPHPVLGWNRPVVHVFFNIGIAADPLLARPSELFELSFPAFFPGEDPLLVLAGEGADVLSLRVRSQATVFADSGNRPLYPLDLRTSVIQVSSDGLVMGHVDRINDSDAAWLLHWDNIPGPDQDGILVVPDHASSEELSSLPLLPDWTDQWVMRESGGGGLMINRPWWVLP